MLSSLFWECQSLVEENRRLNMNGNFETSRSFLHSNQDDLPVESFLLQSQVDTLQWQLKQTESSRKMYREVMEQMVCFLERTHKSLEKLQERLQTDGATQGTMRRSGVPRSRSVHHVSTPPPPVLRAHSTAQIQQDTFNDSPNYNAFKDYTWRRAKKSEPTIDEISPEKLSQEALRLLRTAQSLLNTKEPDLVNGTLDNILPSNEEFTQPNDQDFLSQLAKEFPPQNSLKVVTPNVPQISTAFNRKLSLQRTPSNSPRNLPSNRSSIAETDFPLINPTLFLSCTEENFPGKPQRNSIASNNSFSTSSPNSTLTRQSICCSFDTDVKFKEKSQSPIAGSISSAEDESGFSSMSSFQEIGLPIVNSTMINKGSDKTISTESKNKQKINSKIAMDKSVWLNQQIGLPLNQEKPKKDSTIYRRWSYNPVDTSKTDPLRVLWV